MELSLCAGFGAWYYAKRKYSRDLEAASRKPGSTEGQLHLQKDEGSYGGRRGPLGGQLGGIPPPQKGGISPREANPDKVAAMLAATKADAARARSQRLPSLMITKPGELHRADAPVLCGMSSLVID